ncbi:MAG: hypothetical protein JXA96_11470 [Sedimentisphaerales bacterium]|nr:hypothetical protein [Sedimentisphaerales bacterium]
MKRILTFWVIGMLMSIIGSKSITKAGIQSVIGGTSAPASTLGPYLTLPFEDDLRPSYQQCTYVESPLSGNLDFDLPLEHREVPTNWTTWSNGYTGDIYLTNEGEFFVSLTLPVGTSAFYFYAQPELKAENTITAIAFDGIDCIEQITQEVNGNSGACYFGFYGTNGSDIANVNISSDAAYAIGEFGISMIPAPEAFLLGNIGLFSLIELKRHRIFEK